MKKITTTLILCLLMINLFGQKSFSDKFKYGIYAADSPEFINDIKIRPAYNVIYPDGTGYFWTGDICELGVDKFKWEIRGDTLILNIGESIYRGDCDKEFENSEPHTQYFLIVEIKKDFVKLKYGDIIYPNQTVKGIDFVDEFYIWKRLGNVK